MVFTIHRLTYPTHLTLYLLRSPYRIAHLTEHVKKNRKDYINRYRAIIKALGLRK